MDIKSLENIVLNYFDQFDKSFEEISHKREHEIIKFPSYHYKFKKIVIQYSMAGKGVFIEAIPNDDLLKNEVSAILIDGGKDIKSITSLLTSTYKLDYMPPGQYVQFGDIICDNDDSINSKPVFHFEGLVITISLDLVNKHFDLAKAKLDAFNAWNNILNGLNPKFSYYENLKKIFDVFDAIIKKKSFMERRIHRYLNKHAKILMPNYNNIYYEHKIYGRELYIADFIIEREFGMPPILIELESPAYNIYKKNRELTAEANHAKNQIADWVRCIEENPENTVELKFLKGPKIRLIIMGKGLEYMGEMFNSKYTDTIIWTYTVLRNEAARNQNELIKNQCSMLNIKDVNLIPMISN